MFAGLLGRKFSTKCKHSVKCIKCRIETIRKKKHAMVRCLKKDVADLVSAGHDDNAFARMDGLLCEINQASCYDMIEQYCCCILEHLPAMQKERESPKESVEAMASLIYAAARFSDLPELSDLRRCFTDRYGNCMEPYTNREFADKLQEKSFPHSKKFHLMKDIVMEFSVNWDFDTFEHKISNPSTENNEITKIPFPPSNKNFAQSHLTEDRREAKVTNAVEQHSRKAVQKHQVQPEAHSLLTSTEMVNTVFSKESKNIRPHQLSNIPPPYIKSKGKRSEAHEVIVLAKSQGGAATDNHVSILSQCSKFTDELSLSTRKEVIDEIENNGQVGKHNGAVSLVSKRAFNFKPPYVKPTNSEMLISSGKEDACKKAAFSVRRKAISSIISSSNGGEDGNLSAKISIKCTNPMMPEYDGLANRIVALKKP